MKLSTKQQSSKPRETCDADTYAARCIRVVDLGTHDNKFDPEKKRRMLRITWEISALMSDGKPFCVGKDYTASANPKSNLGQDIKSWNIELDEQGEFELKDLLDKTCLLGVTKTQGKKDPEKFYNNIQSVIQMPNGMPVPDRVNDLFYFQIEDIYNVEMLKKLWPLERLDNAMIDSVLSSDEFKAAGLTMPDYPKKEDEEDEVAF